MNKIIILILSLLGLVCVFGQNVVPYPQQITLTNNCYVSVSPGSISISPSIQSTTFNIAVERYLNLFFPFTNTSSTSDKITLSVSINSDDETLQLGIDESYTLNIAQGSLELKSNTIYGAMRGLETFKQMIVYDVTSNTYSIQCAQIVDYPRYPWRGIMVDSARHFITKNFILHIIDALGYNKFNTMHWHLVDAQSFAVESTTYPDLTQAAFGPKAVFSHDDIQEVVAYAKTYGIRVIPEFDIPGHAAAWGVGYPELTCTCPDYAANINNIPLDISNPNTLTFLQNFFSEIAPLFPDQHFHTGGDELVTGCWNEDQNMVSWMEKMGFSTTDAFQYFENNLDVTMKVINRTKMTWNDPIDYGVQLSPDTVVQVWSSGADLQGILNSGYKSIVSFAWYLDKQVPDGNTHYEWQDTWQDFYNADPVNGITSNAQNIIGGEAAMFAEQVSEVNWDVRVWPRAIGVAERLWSSQGTNSVTSALPRIGAFSCDMSRRGIQSGPLFTDYCPLPEDLAFTLKPTMKLSKSEIKQILNN
ncbi:hypothetical protein DICPUDRAFT_30528 [Dictyostelium purpureum]|uniref:Beta-hexosaminidase n=1 Tax=Dictyostelium purpureum TaxID=5786 RepID=F0ZFK6_DICPU|nr:uncharacterized protein DICPUDRAFT_30528 [Dictyostelium purpureum]EGC37294.1 hypothetical protein DICPUDRAFT_30528 [Dictyostelium purpureum]|eukprot:XP_003286182.1 hypothetical protein DICPUDRAFT_30528 [Dictyostelium purpureum]